MSVPATEAVVGNGLAALMPDPARASAKADKQMFMDLLVAQLRYQDPLNPATPESSWRSRRSSPRWKNCRTSPTRRRSCCRPSWPSVPAAWSATR